MFQNTEKIKIEVNNNLYENINFNFEEKSLNREIEEYIFSRIKNYPLNRTIKLEIYMPRKYGQVNPEMIIEAVHKHFAYKEIDSAISIKQKMREWWMNMMIGILFLILCLILVEICDSFTHIQTVRIIKETLYIICSVALWEPITFILFGLRSEMKGRKYYKKLSKIPITITSDMEKI